MSGCGCGVINLPTGATGAPGADGADGAFGGNSAPYVFSTATTSTPSATFIQFDNANVGAATLMYVHITDRNSANLNLWLTQIGVSTNSTTANIRVFSEADSSKFADFIVTGVSQTGSIMNIGVTSMANSSASPFANNEEIVLTYAQAGNAGQDGADGTTVLSNSNSTVSSGDTASAWVTQKTATIGAGEMDANGDMVYIMSQGVNSDANYATDGETCQFRIQVINNAVATTPISHTFSAYLEQVKIEINFNRITNTTAQILVTETIGGQVVYIGQASVTGIDLTLATTINVQANTTVAGVDTLNLILTKFNI